MLLFNKVGHTPKREGLESVPGARIVLREGIQAPLQGQEVKKGV